MFGVTVPSVPNLDIRSSSCSPIINTLSAVKKVLNNSRVFANQYSDLQPCRILSTAQHHFAKSLTHIASGTGIQAGFTRLKSSTVTKLVFTRRHPILTLMPPRLANTSPIEFITQRAPCNAILTIAKTAGHLCVYNNSQVDKFSI